MAACLVGSFAEMDEKFRRRVEAAVATVQTWDKDVDLLRECYRQIPMDVLRPKRNNHDADDAVDEYSHVNDVELSPTARFVQRLARYFQKRMTWIQTPSCVQCGNSSNDDTTTNPRHSHMEGKGIRGPLTASEIQGEAHRVEVYVCQTCGTETVFPRYNAVRTLLQQHAGRCGEYANLFGLYCRSVGLETRYILDCTDHVWTEVRIGDCGGDGDGWCMVDSCEGVLDENSMYEAGWGKQLSCIVAVSLHQVVDVTPKYTRLWNDADFVARRRAVTSSEESGIRILQHINQRLLLQLSPKEQEQLTRRSAREATLLQHEMRQTFWDHQYGRGRISGSLTWKVSRHEAGKDSSAQDDPPPQQRTVPCHFHVETYYCYYYQNFPTRSAANANTTTTTMLEIVLQAAPCTRHEAVIVNGVACAVGAMNSLSLVVLDEVHFGGILQSRCFQRLVDLADFVTTLPAQRIVAVVGRLPISQDNNDDDAAAVAAANRLSHELPGFQVPLVTAGILYLGQVLVRPDWTYCGSYKDVPRHGVCWKTSPKTCQSLGDVVARRKQKLWTVRNVQPARVTGRVPDSIMPLATQQVAGYEQKRAAFLALVETTTGSDCAGYTTKPGSPIYLLGATAYPFARDDRSEHGWNTFLLVPEELVPDDDVGLLDAPLSTTTTPQYEVPLDASFFVRSFGSHVLTGGNERIPTADALQNTRLVGVYFSAHWCGRKSVFHSLVQLML